MYRMERALEPCWSAWRFRAITSCRRRKTLQFRGNVTICTNKGFSYARHEALQEGRGRTLYPTNEERLIERRLHNTRVVHQ